MNPSSNLQRLERIQELLDELRRENHEVPILVEGDKDETALRNLGLEGEILRVHNGMTIFQLCEVIGREHDTVVILTDWDRTGGQLTRLLREGLAANGVTVRTAYRRELARATRKEVSDVESLDTYLRNLRESAGVAPRGSGPGADGPRNI